MTRILIVEDEPLVRELMVEELHEAGFDVLSATNGEEALALLADQPGIDVLFTDIRMPGAVDGWELARRARAGAPDIWVIYATGYSETSTALGDRDRFVTKPYLPREVLRLLEEMRGG